jgi:hypothetical protein
MACRLAGEPVPQRAPPPNKRAADCEPAADHKSEAMNGSGTAAKKLRFDLSGTQMAAGPPRPKFSIQLKRPAEEQLVSGAGKKAATESAMADKQPTVEDVPGADVPQGTLEAGSLATKKRTAVLDPAVLRERNDGRTKRAKTDAPDGSPFLGLGGAAKTAPDLQQAKPAAPENQTNANITGTCSSCLDMHPMHDMLQLPCKDEGDRENHAYCRDCLQRLFESSVTDPSHFPPRCCNKIISLFSCTPFLPRPLVARFVERREELGTINRTYCSNNMCSRWVRPANIAANVGTCTDCKEKTCTTCKGKQHMGLCPEDKDVKTLMTVAKQKRWQTCPKCKEMVELERGCYHIT